MLYWLIKTLCAIFAKSYLSYRIINRNNLVGLNDSGYVVASNHVSFLDPPLIGIAFKESIFFFARKTLFDNPVAGWVLGNIKAIPVSQDKPEMSTMKQIIRLLKEGEKVVIFPEGERTYDGKIKDKGQAGVGMLVEKSKAKVIPVRLFGPEKALPRNGKKVMRVPVTLVVGEPIDFSELFANTEINRKTKYEMITAEIMDAIRRLEIGDQS